MQSTGLSPAPITLLEKGEISPHSDLTLYNPDTMQYRLQLRIHIRIRFLILSALWIIRRFKSFSACLITHQVSTSTITACNIEWFYINVLNKLNNLRNQTSHRICTTGHLMSSPTNFNMQLSRKIEDWSLGKWYLFLIILSLKPPE